MIESVKKRISEINSAEDSVALKRVVCPFYEKGDHPDCKICRKSDEDVEECRDYYLSRIAMHPMDIWNEEFDKVVVLTRDTTPLEDIIGIGVTCNNCYMSERCPLFKKDYACAVNWQSKKPESPSEFMDFLISMQYERVQRSSVFEKIDGGVSDLGLSGEMDRLNNYIVQKDNLLREKVSFHMEASAPASGGGILSKLFGGAKTPAIESTEVIRAEVVEEEKEVLLAKPKNDNSNSKTMEYDGKRS